MRRPYIPACTAAASARGLSGRLRDAAVVDDFGNLVLVTLRAADGSAPCLHQTHGWLR